MQAINVPPTDTHSGYTLFQCACGYSYTEGYPSCQEHVAGQGVITKMPTESQSGNIVYSCLHCGEFLREETLPSIGEHRKQCPSASYVDTPSYLHWAHDGIDKCLVEGLFRGLDEGHFDPNGAMTRAMMVVVLWRLEGCPRVSSPSSFPDVVPYAWYADAVAWAQGMGIVNGMDDGTFSPLARITREQIVTILYRYRTLGSDREPPSQEVLKKFPDASSISDYAKEAFAWAVHKGYIFGMSEQGRVLLAPKETATRAQAATLFTRLPR